MENSANSHPAHKGMQTTMFGILGNTILVLIKGVAGALGHSYALIADAIESASDVLTSIIVWLGLKAAAKKPDSNHPYGHGKAEPLATIVVSIALVAAAIIISVESVRYIMTPHPSPAPFTLGILSLIIVIKEVLYRYVHKVGNQIESGVVKADAWHHRSDAITSLTAFIGITIALIGGKGYESADDWAALVAAFIILYNAYRIFLPAFTELMDAAPPSEISEEIKEIASRVPHVRAIEKCLVRKMGFEYFVDIHIVVDGTISVREGHDIGHNVKNEIIRHKPVVYDVLTHIEPDEM